MKVIILAAGYAVRLQPLTLNTPKPLLEIGGKKIIDRILGKVKGLKNISDIYIITNAKFFQSFSDWRSRSEYKNKIRVINDGSSSNDTRLGAIKDIEIVVKANAIDDDLLVIAGDNLFEFGLDRFLDFAKDKSDDGMSVALHDIKSLELAKNFGVVSVDERNRMVDFEEKPASPKSTLISTGIYYFPKGKIPLLEEYVKSGNSLDAPGYYIRWAVATGNVYGFTFTEDWYDIGNIESYKKANEDYLKKEKRTK